MGINAIRASLKQMLWLAIGNRKTIRRLRRSKTRMIVIAVETLIVPLARGLSLVRCTRESIFLSQRSLAMQPKALTNIPPKVINVIKSQEGGAEGVNHRDHPAGISKIILPVGLSQRSKLNKTLSFFVNR